MVEDVGTNPEAHQFDDADEEEPIKTNKIDM